jgi:acetate kinase
MTSPEADTGVLIINTGSSTLKLRLLDRAGVVIAAADVDPWDGHDVDPIRSFVTHARGVGAVGHRVVHGGEDLRVATVIGEEVLRQIESLTTLAPLHQPRAVAAIRAARDILPDVPHVACFDTAYHAGMPEAAATYPLPPEWRDRWPLRRFGFHGLSHAHAARRAEELIGPGTDRLRVVTCHLGAGASLCASLGERSVDTTMGFTPLDGLVMQTRSGALDPGLVVWLCTEGGLDPAEVGHQLARRSGLAALTGGSGDMRDVIDRWARGDQQAALAFEVYVHRLGREIAAMTASLIGLDALVFTGGIGQHTPEIREAAVARLSHLGVALDRSRNSTAIEGGDHDLSPSGASVRVLVVEAREDLEIARQTRGALRASREMPG